MCLSASCEHSCSQGQFFIHYRVNSKQKIHTAKGTIIRLCEINLMLLKVILHPPKTLTLLLSSIFSSDSNLPQQYECDVDGKATNLSDNQQAVGHCSHRCAWNVPTLQRYPIIFRHHSPFHRCCTSVVVLKVGLGLQTTF